MNIKSYEGLYSVSTNGVITAQARTIINKNGVSQRYPEKVLKADKGKYGHCRVTLCKNHKTVRFLVHRLVATAYLPNPDNKPYVNHIDNDPSNNGVSNLEWCTHSENMLHAQKQGRLLASQSKGGKNGGITAMRSNNANSEMVGSTMGCWLVTGIAEHRKGKQYFSTTCTVCGNTTERSKSYLKLCQTPNCIKCKKRD